VRLTSTLFNIFRSPEVCGTARLSSPINTDVKKSRGMSAAIAQFRIFHLYLTGGCGGGQVVGRAPDPLSATVKDMRVNHCRGDVPVTEKFLDRADVVAGIEQMRGE